ncbi:hypothetical protein B0181_01385 [Moraxella caviae]|uniref:Domain of uncharacterized function (DUF74) n=1 Tax=Moraxella caviae TaxID=34060 RepID=A0A1T0AAQ2_9GAMM|nr:heavy metal-binding domain-containing protein [Moraxella caviae]OOR92814.1 hypothetical protein B0181_01385 [Moraxella caviae]STZ14148.1 Domain of uncharacterised function (DUF74) [Moraxella caviae]
MSEMSALLLNNLGLVIALLLLIIGWIFGRRSERKHLQELNLHEQSLAHVILTSERFAVQNYASESLLVVGNVVVAQDRFKMVAATILSLFGKNLTVYESLLERARREAIVRLKRQAAAAGFHYVTGVRLEVSNIGAHDPSGSAVEVIAYGTAVHLR